MAIALQWHVVTNLRDAVALATPRDAETGIGQKDVVIVICDARQGDLHDTRIAASLARDIFDTYASHEPSAATRSPNSMELAQRLSEAIVQGLKRAQSAGQPVAASRDLLHPATAPSHNPDAATAAHAESNAAISADRRGARNAPAGLAGMSLSVVAAVIRGDQLYVARHGGGDAFLLRGGQLLHLTDATFATPHTSLLEPDLGQLDLSGEDRVLLCTSALNTALNEGQIKSVLRATPSSRKAANNMLDLAERAHVIQPLALAVADFVSGQTGIFPATPLPTQSNAPVTGSRRGTFRKIVAGLSLLGLVAFAAWAFTAFAGSRSGIPVTPASSSATNAAPTPPATFLPALIITPTQTTAPSPSPSPEPTATNTPADTPTAVPSNTPTVVPTETPEPTPAPTDTPAPTRRPTRRPPTATPVPPTATPLPPTPEPTLAPTDTPVPPPPPSSGGGEPPPPGCGQIEGMDCQSP